MIRKTEPPIDHLLSTNEGSSPGTGIHPIELPAKGSHENPKQPMLSPR